MAKIIFYHKADSPYDDQPDKFYHFPSQYLRRVESAIGDQAIYYGTLPGKSSRYYFATARIVGIRPDTARAKHYYADMAEYLDFDRMVDYRGNGGYERALVGPDGKISGGAAVNAVRPLAEDEFTAIIEAGLSTREQWPDRDEKPQPNRDIDGFAEGQTFPLRRPIVEEISSRSFRDIKFRQNIRTIYDRTCSFSGLRLINGKGRPEVEAAHIVPVENGGTDSVRNGIALSATVHWMFDRGMLSLGDDFRILTSRHLNEDVSHLLNADLQAKVPVEQMHRPHPNYLRWHRDNIFKT
jgi:putative restriction endonuclease